MKDVLLVVGGVILGAAGLALIAWVWVIKTWPRP